MGKNAGSKKVWLWISRSYGMLVTLYLLVAFVPKFFAQTDSLSLSLNSLFNWRENPVDFFFMYLTGYILHWFRPVTGAIILFGSGLTFVIFNSGNLAFWPAFFIPVIWVGIFILHFEKKAEVKSIYAP